MESLSVESEHNNNIQLKVPPHKDHTFSKKMEGEEGVNLNTVVGLRGRLLAERQASRVAKEEAESMENKLFELEKLLREETKLRDKAERKLRFLKKKVESFNLSSKSGKLQHCDLSEKCESSCGSSSITTASQHSEANVAIHHLAKHSALSENDVDHNHNSSSSSKDCDSQNTDNASGDSSPQILSENQKPGSGNLKNDESRFCSLSSRSSVAENESDNADFCDNSLAIVPVTMMTPTSQATKNSKPLNVSVLEALNALRRAKESLQSSMGPRQMIHVGPI